MSLEYYFFWVIWHCSVGGFSIPFLLIGLVDELKLERCICTFRKSQNYVPIHDQGCQLNWLIRLWLKSYREWVRCLKSLSLWGRGFNTGFSGLQKPVKNRFLVKPKTGFGSSENRFFSICTSISWRHKIAGFISQRNKILIFLSTLKFPRSMFIYFQQFDYYLS